MLWWTLRQLKSKDSRKRIGAAKKLADLKNPRTVEPLLAALKDNDVHVRWWVARSLGCIGDSRAIEPLVRALKEGNVDVPHEAAKALNRIDPKWEETKAAKQAIPDLLAALMAVDPWVVIHASHALRRIDASWEKSKAAKQAVPDFVAALKSDGRKVRNGAAYALGCTGDPRAVEPLVAALTTGACDLEAVRALGKIGDARALEPLIAALILIIDGEDSMRWAAAEALGKIGDSRAVEPLRAALADSHSVVREQAAKALDRIDSNWRDSEDAKRAVPGLVAGLEDLDPPTRMAAVWALKAVGWQPADEKERELYERASGAVRKELKTADTVITEIDSALSAIRNALATGKRIPSEPIRSRGISIMKFSTGHESNYKHHIDLLTHLADQGFLGRYDLWRLDLSGADDLCGLIVVCGSADDMTNYARKTYYLPAAEAFVAEKCGGDWNKIDAASSISDTPDSGMGIDLSGAEHDLAELRAIVLDRVSGFTRIESSRATMKEVLMSSNIKTEALFESSFEIPFKVEYALQEKIVPCSDLPATWKNSGPSLSLSETLQQFQSFHDSCVLGLKNEKRKQAGHLADLLPQGPDDFDAVFTGMPYILDGKCIGIVISFMGQAAIDRAASRSFSETFSIVRTDADKYLVKNGEP